MSSHHLGVPTSEYSLHVPTIPSIQVPPSRDNKCFELPPYTGLPLLADPTIPRHDTTLKALLTCSLGPNIIRDWAYKMRRQAHKILPFLYLGPSASARDIDTLRADGITMLLVVRNTRTAQAMILSGDKVAAQLGIEAKAVDVAGHQELIAAFPNAIQIINEHIVSTFREGLELAEPWDREAYPDHPVSSGKVLVFCESGNERSAAVVAAYLMAMYDLDVVSAVQCIQCLRFCVGFDEELKNLLLNWQEIVAAQRTIGVHIQLQQRQQYMTQNEPGGGVERAATKRGRGEMDNDIDVDMQEADDMERFKDREFKVPFDSDAVYDHNGVRESSTSTDSSFGIDDRELAMGELAGGVEKVALLTVVHP